MTSNGIDRSALFLAMPTTDGPDGPGLTFDGGEEAMRRLRHPFAVEPVGQSRGLAAHDDAEQRH
ncbi:hypothetical protein ACFO0M_20945 [Micromonospora mangrovi]|uniref:Uncharacterized protein n=2 Tax=Micromonospora TaxID=1873 RepID=A0AAU7M3N4_9ACTN